MSGKKVIRAVGSVLLCAVIIVSVLATFVLALVRLTVTNEGFFFSIRDQRFPYSPASNAAPCVDTYSAHVEERIDRSLPADTYNYFGEQYGDVSAILDSCVDKEVVRDLSGEYLKRICRALNQGEKIEDVHYPAEKFIPLTDYMRPQVLAEEEKVREKEASLGVDPKDSTAMSEEEIDASLAELRTALASRIDSYINSFHSIRLVDKSVNILELGYEKVFSKTLFKSLFSVSALIPLAAAIAACVGLWFLSAKGDKLKKTYNVVAVLWIAVTLYAIPMMLFKAYDLPSKLLLGDSFFKITTVAVLEGVTGTAFTLAIIPFAAFTVALVTLIVLIIIRSAKEAGTTPAAEVETLEDADRTAGSVEAPAQAEISSETEAESAEAPDTKPVEAGESVEAAAEPTDAASEKTDGNDTDDPPEGEGNE